MGWFRAGEREGSEGSAVVVAEDLQDVEEEVDEIEVEIDRRQDVVVVAVAEGAGTGRQRWMGGE